MNAFDAIQYKSAFRNKLDILLGALKNLKPIQWIGQVE